MTTTIDFDAILSDAFDAQERKARVLTYQEQRVMKLQGELLQAERALDELQREFDSATQEVEDLATYTDYKFDDSGYERFTPLEFD